MSYDGPVVDTHVHLRLDEATFGDADDQRRILYDNAVELFGLEA